VHEWLTMIVRFMCLFHQHYECIVSVRERESGLFETLCVQCNFDADARVCIFKKTFKKLLTKQSLEEPAS
jgi:hypothetical protein